MDNETESPPVIESSSINGGPAVDIPMEVASTKASHVEVLEQSGSHKAIQNLLRVYYEPLELWFLRISIEKVSPPRIFPLLRVYD